MNNSELWNAIDRIEAMLNGMMTLLNELVASSRYGSLTKAAYSVAEAAKLLDRAPYTIREHCRLGRIKAAKRPIGRGGEQEWEISHEELERYRNHGLLPMPKRY